MPMLSISFSHETDYEEVRLLTFLQAKNADTDLFFPGVEGGGGGLPAGRFAF